MSVRRRQIGRLAPLVAQLALAWRRRSGEIPPALLEAGRYGERHIAMLISLAIEGPATVSVLAQRLDITAAHASLVVGELARAGPGRSATTTSEIAGSSSSRCPEFGEARRGRDAKAPRRSPARVSR